MRLPTLGEVVSAAQRNVQRFPLVLLSGAATTYAALSMVERSMDEPTLIRVMVAASLGLPLLFGLTVLAERKSESTSTRLAIQGIGVAILFAVWWAWPAWTSNIQGMRFAQLSAAFHLFVAFAPFIGRDEPRAFWQYNRILFIRYLIGALYSAVLWLGLSGAFLALDKLLGVDIPSEAYLRLWIVIAFIFNPWFFVSGVPADIGALERSDEYPTGLRVFTQYVLVPIVALYLVILTIYFGKVVLSRQWPHGWIGGLVSSVAGAGTLAWLLVHPLESKPEHAWVKGYTRGFYAAILPAIVMLWLAIYKRVEQYGITERRYFLIILSVWLAGTAVYYTLSKSRNIKLIPASLCLIALIGFAGPQGAYSVSMRSQRDRLQTLLEKNGLFEGGHLKRTVGTVPDSAARQISEAFRYLLEIHGAAPVQPWLAGDVGKGVGAIGSGSIMRAEIGSRTIMTAMNVRYFARYGDGIGENFYFYAPVARFATRIDGYNYAIRLTNTFMAGATDTTTAMHVRVVDAPPALEVRQGGAVLMSIPLGDMVDSARAYQQRGTPAGLPRDALTYEFHDGDKAALVVLTNLSGVRDRGAPRINGIDGELFIRIP